MKIKNRAYFYKPKLTRSTGPKFQNKGEQICGNGLDNTVKQLVPVDSLCHVL